VLHSGVASIDTSFDSKPQQHMLETIDELPNLMNINFHASKEQPYHKLTSIYESKIRKRSQAVVMP
jgi:hypothetical protein